MSDRLIATIGWFLLLAVLVALAHEAYLAFLGRRVHFPPSWSQPIAIDRARPDPSIK
jgi:hypothetical protein